MLQSSRWLAIGLRVPSRYLARSASICFSLRVARLAADALVWRPFAWYASSCDCGARRLGLTRSQQSDSNCVVKLLLVAGVSYMKRHSRHSGALRCLSLCVLRSLAGCNSSASSTHGLAPSRWCWAGLRPARAKLCVSVAGPGLARASAACWGSDQPCYF